MKIVLIALFAALNSHAQPNPQAQCGTHFLASSFAPSARTEKVGLMDAEQIDSAGRVIRKASEGAKETRIVAFDNLTYVEGPLGKVFRDNSDEPAYLGFNGPSRLISFEKGGIKEIPNQGFKWHEGGFGMPVGTPTTFSSKIGFDASFGTKAEWNKAGVIEGEEALIEYASGVNVTGVVDSFYVDSFGVVKIITFKTGTAEVTYGTEILFDRSWGVFDLLIGNKVVNSAVAPEGISKFVK